MMNLNKFPCSDVVPFAMTCNTMDRLLQFLFVTNNNSCAGFESKLGGIRIRCTFRWTPLFTNNDNTSQNSIISYGPYHMDHMRIDLVLERLWTKDNGIPNDFFKKDKFGRNCANTTQLLTHSLHCMIQYELILKDERLLKFKK